MAKSPSRGDVCQLKGTHIAFWTKLYSQVLQYSVLNELHFQFASKFKKLKIK